LSNLIDNSAQAINERGTIAISLKDDGNQIHIVVSDTGKGIPKDVLPRLATKNFTYEKKGGTGLGLYDAKLWVEKKGGNMKIESQVNSGTTLTLTLPKENL
jgi:signal transduction histidine kinase